MTSTLAPRTTSPDTLTTRGRWCLAAGLLGLAQGVAVLVWPHQVDEARFSFPFTATGFVLAQATFFLQHLPLVMAVGALAGLPAIRREHWAHRTLVIATVGLSLLALQELVAMSAATTDTETTLGTTINSLYGIPVLMTGVGLAVAGVVLLRRDAVGRPLAWTLIALGAFVFVGLGPALATDSFVAGRLAIAAWMLLFALLGWLMQRAASQSQTGVQEPQARTPSVR